MTKEFKRNSADTRSQGTLDAALSGFIGNSVDNIHHVSRNAHHIQKINDYTPLTSISSMSADSVSLGLESSKTVLLGNSAAHDILNNTDQVLDSADNVSSSSHFWSKIFCPLNVVVDSARSVTAIRDAHNQPTARKILNATVMSSKTVGEGAVVGLNFAGKVSEKCLGKTFSYLGVGMSVYFTLDTLFDPEKSFEQKVKATSSSVLNITGILLSTGPIFPVGLCLIAGSACVDTFWKC